MKELKECSVEGCCNPSKTKTFCANHYARYQRHGDPLGGGPSRAVLAVSKKCRIEGCTNVYKSGQWCHAHYERFKKYGDPLKGGSFHEENSEKCKMEGCGKPSLAKCLCGGHYSLFRKYGDPSIAKHKWYQNGRDEWHESTSTGYIWRYVGRQDPQASKHTGYVYQHRVVMSEMLGRMLKDNENVHHINGDRKDNRPENLELWVKSQPAGQRVSDLLMWARQILEDYKDLA